MRDGIKLARAGVPTVALVTTDFVAQADFVARSAGMPAIPRVVLPHPVAGTGAANLQRVADDAAAAVVEALGGTP